MKAEELTVKVSCDLTVSRETAEACMKLLEIYCNAHKTVVCAATAKDGTTTLSLYDCICEKKGREE